LKVSDITAGDLADYLRIDGDPGDPGGQLEILLDAARAYVRSYTGLDDEQIDLHDDFNIAVFILVQDMYDNRVLYIDKNNPNRTVETILGMHSVNLV